MAATKGKADSLSHETCISLFHIHATYIIIQYLFPLIRDTRLIFIYNSIHNVNIFNGKLHNLIWYIVIYMIFFYKESIMWFTSVLCKAMFIFREMQEKFHIPPFFSLQKVIRFSDSPCLLLSRLQAPLSNGATYLWIQAATSSAILMCWTSSTSYPYAGPGHGSARKVICMLKLHKQSN